MQDDPALLLLLTPHKMFRRAFLLEQGIRFLEGPRYLEDHAFVMTAYFRAEVISVLAGYTCYFWHRRRGSAGRRPKDWGRYFDSMRDVLDVVEEHTTPGELRDRLLSHWYRTKGLRRLGPKFIDLPEAEARAFFQGLRALTLERFPPRLDSQRQLGSLRLRAALLRAGAYEKTRELAAVERAMYVTEHVDDLRVSPNRLELTLTATLRHGDGSALRLDRADGLFVLPPPVSLAGDRRTGVGPGRRAPPGTDDADGVRAASLDRPAVRTPGSHDHRRRPHRRAAAGERHGARLGRPDRRRGRRADAGRPVVARGRARVRGMGGQEPDPEPPYLS